MDDLLKRLGAVEGHVSDIRVQLNGFATQIPNLATKTDVGSIAAQIPHLATRADLAQLDGAIGRMEASLIRWLIGTSIAIAGLAFAIARFVH